MLNPNELRLGNWAQETDTNGKIHYFQVNIDFLETLVADNDIFDPIPLTPVILEKCGFKKMESPSGSNFFYELGEWSVHPIFNQGYSIWLQTFTLRQIEYLHQLQNLYFALTGDELPVNLETTLTGDIEIAE